MTSTILRIARRLTSGQVPRVGSRVSSTARWLSYSGSHAQSSSAIVARLLPTEVDNLYQRVERFADEARKRHRTLSESAEGTSGTSDLYAELRALSPLMDGFERIQALGTELGEARDMISDPDSPGDLISLAKEEEEALLDRIRAEKTEVISHVVEYKSVEGDTDENNSATQQNATQGALVEVRAGAGGDEAALFAGDVYEMYRKYAGRKQWRCRELSLSQTDLRGIREVIFRVDGMNAYNQLKLEAGVHRVQRVPQTESSGRVHTSTISVAVLKDDANHRRTIKLDDKDIKMDVYRASGAGGQHVNKTESAVRLTHIPTGLVATSQEDRSQHRNRALAMDSLIARVAAKAAAEAAAAKVAERQAQLGSVLGERSDRIRTYNFPQNRVTDHRVSPPSVLLSLAPSLEQQQYGKNADLENVLQGGEQLDSLIDGVQWQMEVQRIESVVQMADDSARAEATATVTRRSKRKKADTSSRENRAATSAAG